MNRDPIYLEQILTSIQQIEGYIAAADENSFMEDEQLLDAYLLRLILIGEAPAKISEATKNAHPQIPWKIINAARNFYVHNYMSVAWLRVWDTITTVLSPLKTRIAAILQYHDNEE